MRCSVLFIKNRIILADKKNFILRINEETFRQLEKWAADEFRSVNGQIEWIIDKALKDAGRKKKEQGENGDRKKKEPQ